MRFIQNAGFVRVYKNVQNSTPRAKKAARRRLPVADDITCRLNANSVTRVYSAFLPALTVYLLASILSMDFEKIFEKLIFVRFIGHMTCYYTLRNQTNVYKYTMEGTDMKDDREILKRELMKLLDEIPLERLKALYIKALVASSAK